MYDKFGCIYTDIILSDGQKGLYDDVKFLYFLLFHINNVKLINKREKKNIYKI